LCAYSNWLCERNIIKTYLEYEDIRGMEDAASCVRDKLLIQLLFRLGCRISEALTLLVENVDFINGLVTIIHLKTRAKLMCPDCEARLSRNSSYCSKCGIKIDKTKMQQQEHRKFRTLPVDKETMGMLQDYINRGGPVLKDGKRLIFGINRHRAWQIIRDCAGRSGLPPLINQETGKVHGVSPHRLRDSFSVNAVKRNDSGDGLRLLQEHLGHASFNTTARYRKVAGEEHRRWYDQLWEEEK
jgi:integrase/recombinase XerD